MTATETLHPDLPADLVDRVLDLSPAARKSLGGLLEREDAEEAADHRALWDEIRRRLDGYDRGEVKAVDGGPVLERLRETIRVMKAGAPA